ncbi:FGGY-family carbohydrate kinase [Gluconacetobacter azotocaptans]|uniref:FGGY-family carbohydrate kinase n=1 Tax=Gluconacetobacter azotocaptans TaxID=142834 RepID=A0A7W4JT63_9PROT|nr:FGGY-family carbohydrate kinase [Gluconacetobacter azotocaptans]MBB2190420.1 FGGY-family carbohydrate kinase [Gluconacetobacter azotocaptans]GBQ30184.1 ribulokinase [Gluconacetobacter azotocaptans DSM 13594]
MDVVLGIDVGTGSARAGVFTADGRKLGAASRATRTWHPRANIAQQSSADIWRAVCASVSDAMTTAAERAGTPLHVRGIGFDATCSLVVLDGEGAPLSVDAHGAAGQDVILWMDHRAMAEAARINAGGYEVLRYVGGVISPEMETPKLLWLKDHLPDIFDHAGYFFDLPDFLTWRATGSDSRSRCSTVCKWTYLAHEDRWDDSYFRGIGLGRLVDEGHRRIGTDIRPLGGQVGSGLTAQAAEDLGLPQGTPVAVSAIDAHAGGIGLIGAAPAPGGASFDRRLALIGGTSSCHMVVSSAPRFVPGVWGPYFDAMLPGLWLNEAGQSATGSLVDFVIASHPATPALRRQAEQDERTIYQALNDILAGLEQGHPSGTCTRDLHVMPDFHGNRSPHADPDLRGMISGLALSATDDDLACLYLATIQGLAYGTRDIIDALNGQGYAIDTILATGGGTKNPVFVREHANATGCRILLPEEPDAVLLGSAILGAVAGGVYPSIGDGMAAMSRTGAEILPDARSRGFHDAKFQVFRQMYANQKQYRDIMSR